MSSLEVTAVLAAVGAMVGGVIFSLRHIKGQRIKSKCCGAELAVSDDDDVASALRDLSHVTTGSDRLLPGSPLPSGTRLSA